MIPYRSGICWLSFNVNDRMGRPSLGAGGKRMTLQRTHGLLPQMLEKYNGASFDLARGENVNEGLSNVGDAAGIEDFLSV